MLCARVLRKFIALFGFDAIRKGFKKLFGFDGMHKGFKEQLIATNDHNR